MKSVEAGARLGVQGWGRRKARVGQAKANSKGKQAYRAEAKVLSFFCTCLDEMRCCFRCMWEFLSSQGGYGPSSVRIAQLPNSLQGSLVRLDNEG